MTVAAHDYLASLASYAANLQIHVSFGTSASEI